MDKLIFLRIIPKFLLKVKDEEPEIFLNQKTDPNIQHSVICLLFIKTCQHILSGFVI